MPGKKEEKAPEGAPEWMVTYGDAMTLLLCFFVILVSMSELKKDQKFMQVMESLQRAFGYDGSVGAVPTKNVPTNTLIKRLMELQPPERKEAGDSDVKGIQGKQFRVTNVRDGIEVVYGGRITFDRFSATVRPEFRELLEKTAERLRGYNTKLLIRGHATRERVPEHSIYESQRDLSYARAKAVARILEKAGVRAERLLLVAVGDAEPLKRQAYTEKRRAENRRVEIIVTEDLIDDYAGSTQADDLKESGDGR